MQESFTKLCALENEMGRLPDWFITCTMNIKNPAILEALRPGESPYKRPDVVMRVWEEYTAELKKDLFKKGVLGACEAWAMVLEHQGRGVPHLHIVMWVADCPGKGTPEWLNKLNTAAPCPKSHNLAPPTGMGHTMQASAWRDLGAIYLGWPLIASVNINDCLLICGPNTRNFQN
jgi:hypothetical protein